MKRNQRRHGRELGALALLLVAGCRMDAAPIVLGDCDADNAGLTLPEGFCAVVYADIDGLPRHIAVRPDGDVFAAARRGRNSGVGGVYAMRDTTGDGRADIVVRFGPDEVGGTGIEVDGDRLFFAPDDAVLRYTVPAGSLEPSAGPDTVVAALPAARSHRAKTLALRGDELFVNIGSPSNSCQDPDRQPGVPGMDPCPELETRAGIWRFESGRTGQTQADGERFATGIRNAVALAVHPDGQLYAVQHGRDQLAASWGFTDRKSAETPAEELFRVDRGDDYGWPYCYYDSELERKVLAPEYGGNGEEAGRCADAEDPLYAFPAHWAPNDMLFYTGGNFPARYHDGVFVVFHGSWNRAPLEQGGYNVVFLPFGAGVSTGEFEIFADGFAGGQKQPGEAAHRPTGIAQGPDGALYITDDQAGRIWRVTWRGS